MPLTLSHLLWQAYNSSTGMGGSMDESKQPEPDASCGTMEELDAILDSPALSRLIEEIRYEESGGVPRGYNRTFNRHNR